jgi:hypothetical protein
MLSEGFTAIKKNRHDMSSEGYTGIRYPSSRVQYQQHAAD